MADYGAYSPPGLGGEVDTRTLEVLMKYQDQGVAQGFQGLDSQMDALGASASKAGDRLSGSLGRAQSQYEKMAQSAKVYGAAMKSVMAGENNLDRQIASYVKIAPRANAALDKTTQSFKDWKRQNAGSVFTAITSGMFAVDKGRENMSRFLLEMRKGLTGASRDAELYKIRMGGVAGAMMESLGAAGAVVTAQGTIRQALADVGDATLTASQKWGSLGLAAEDTGSAVRGASGVMAVAAGMARHSGGTFGKMAGAAASAAGKLLVVGGVAVEIGKGIRNMSDAAQRGESIIPPFLAMVTNALKALALGIALAMGGWPAVIALVVAALYKLVSVINRVTETYRAFVKDLMAYPLDRFLNPKKLLGDLQGGFDLFFKNTLGRMQDVLRNLPGPMGQAQKTIDAFVGGVKKGSQIAYDGFNLVVGGVTAAALEMREFESITNAYNQAMSGMGITGRQLLDTLNRETMGLVAQEDAMQQVTMSLGLIGEEAFKQMGGFEQTFSRMAKTSMAAARATGQDVSFMFQSLVTGIGRASPMWLDNLAIGVRAGEVYEKTAKKLGKNAEALTITERKVALMTAALEKGDEMVRQYGISTGGVNTQIQKLVTNFKDATLGIVQGFYPILKPFMTVLANLSDTLRGIVPIFENFFKMLRMIPEPIRNAVLALSAMEVVTSALASGPAQQLLSMFGLQGDALVMIAQRSKLAVAGLMFLATAYQKNWLGMQTLMEPIMRFPELVKRSFDEVSKRSSEQLKNADMYSRLMGNYDVGIKRGYYSLGPDQEQIRAQAMSAAEMYKVALEDSMAAAGVTMKDLIVEGDKGALTPEYAKINSLAADKTKMLKGSVAGLRNELGKLGAEERKKLGLDAKMLANLERLDFAYDSTSANTRTQAMDLAALTGRHEQAASSAQRIGEAMAISWELAKPHLYMLIGSAKELAESFHNIWVGGNQAQALADFERNLINIRVSAVNLTDIFVELTSSLAHAFGGQAKESAEQFGDTVIGALSQLPGMILQEATIIASQLGYGIAASVNNISSMITGIGKNIGGWLANGIASIDPASLTGKFLTFFDTISGSASQIYKSLVGLFTTLYMEVGRIWSKIAPVVYEQLANAMDKLAEAIPRILPRIWDMFWGGFASMVHKVHELVVGGASDAVGGMIDAYKGGLPRVAASARNLFTSVIETGKRMWVILKGYWKEIGPELAAIWERARPVVVKALSVLIGAMVLLLKESAKLVWDAIQALLEDQSVSSRWASAGAKFLAGPKAWFEMVAMDLGGRIATALVDGILNKIQAEHPRLFAIGSMIATGIGAIYGPGIGGGGGFGGGGGAVAEPPGTGERRGAAIQGAIAKVAWGHGLPGNVMGTVTGRIGSGNYVGSEAQLRANVAAGQEAAAGFQNPLQAILGGMPSIGAQEEEAGADGKGGKGGAGAGAGGSEKDPLQEAMSAISSVASAIQAGLAALKAVWTDFLGEPPDRMMDQVFDALKHILDRALELAGDIFEPGEGGAAKAQAIEAAISVLSNAIGAISSVVDLSQALMKARPIDPAQLTAVFASVKQIGEFAFGLTEAFGLDVPVPAEDAAATGLQNAVKRITLAGEVAGVITSWASAIQGMAEAGNAVSRFRTDADFSALGPTIRQVLTVAEDAVTEVTRFAGADTVPMAMMQLKTVGELLGPWLQSLTSTVELANAWSGMREPPANFLDGPTAWLRQIMGFAETVSTEFTTKWGQGFMLKAEDMGIVGGAFEPWIAAVSGIADAAQAVWDTRTGAQISPALGWLDQILEFAQAATAKLSGPYILRLTEDMTAVGEALATWPPIFSALGEVARSASDVMTMTRRGVNLPSAEGWISEILSFTEGLVGSAISRMGAHPDVVIGDIRNLGESLAAWTSLISGLGDVVAAAESAQAASGRGVGSSLGWAKEALVQVGQIAAELVGGAIGHYGDEKKAIESWGNAAALAEALSGWVGLLSAMGEMAEASRQLVKYRSTALDGISVAMSLLEAMARNAFTTFGAGIMRQGATEDLGVSGAIAGTLASWRDLLTGMADFSISLRKTAHGLPERQAKTVIGQTVELLRYMSVEAYRAFGQAMRGAQPGASLETSAAIATTLQSWTDAISSTVGLTRVLREAKPVNKTDLNAVVGVLDTVRRVADVFGSFFANDPLPSATTDLYTQVADSLTAMVNALSTAAGLGRTLAEMVVPRSGEIDAVSRVATSVWNEMRVLSETITDMVEWELEEQPRIQAFTEAFGQLVGTFSSVVGLDTSSFIEPTAREIARVKTAVTAIWEAMRDLVNWMPGLDRGPLDAEEQARAWQAWQTSVGSILGVVGTVSELFLSSTDTALITPGVLTTVRANLSMVFSLFETVAKDWAKKQRVPEISANQVQQWASTANALLDVVTSAFSLGEALSGEEAPKLGWNQGGQVAPPILARLKDMTAAIVTTFSELARDFESVMGGSGDPNRDRATAERMLGYMQAYAGSAGGMIDALSGMVGLLADLTDVGHKVLGISPVTKGVLKQAIGDVVELFTELANGFGMQSVVKRNELSKVAEFATMVNTIMAPIKTVTDAILGLNEFLWEMFTPQEGQAPAKPNSPWRYGSRSPSGVTDAGQKVYKRWVQVTRDDIKRVLDFTGVFWRELDTVMQDIKREWAQLPENAEKEWDKYVAEFGAWTEKAGGAVGMISQVTQAIDSLLQSPLTVLMYTTRSAGRDRNKTIWDTAGLSTLRQRRVGVQDQANMLKDSVKLMLTTIITALNEAFQDPVIANGIPTQDKIAKINDLALAVTTLTSALDVIKTTLPARDNWENTDDDILLRRVKTFVDACNELNNIRLPDWMLRATAVQETAIASLVNALSMIQVFTLPQDLRDLADILERIARAAGGFGGLGGGLTGLVDRAAIVGGAAAWPGGQDYRGGATMPVEPPDTNVSVSVSPNVQVQANLQMPGGAINLLATLVQSRVMSPTRASGGAYTAVW